MMVVTFMIDHWLRVTEKVHRGRAAQARTAPSRSARRERRQGGFRGSWLDPLVGAEAPFGLVVEVDEVEIMFDAV